MFALYPTIFERYLIEVRNRKLKHGCERDPEEIWDVHIEHPDEPCFAQSASQGKCPDERAEDKEDIGCRKEIVLEAELEGGEGEIEN